MNSPKNLNYETRPVKFTERKMLLSSLQRICNTFKNSYQYLGMGGLAFTDFKLFHKELHIDDMHSIEGGEFTKEKLNFNAPYSFINIYKDRSSNALANIDLSKKSVVWLDYDGVLDNYMFEDLLILFNKLPVGSVYLMTCNRELKNESTGELYTIEEFKEKFDDVAPFKLKQTDFAGASNFKTIRKMLYNLIEKVIKDRKRSGENIRFQQLYNIVYQENRGAKMFTWGGIILDEKTSLEDLNISDLDFVNESESPYQISIPNLTLKEIDLINNHLKDDTQIKALLNKKIVSRQDVEKYKLVYKYLPTFFDVRV